MNTEEAEIAVSIEEKTGATISNTSECRGCGEVIWWGVTRNGKNCPFDPDGTPHFVTCPNAADFRKPNRR